MPRRMVLLPTEIMQRASAVNVGQLTVYMPL